MMKCLIMDSSTRTGGGYLKVTFMPLVYHRMKRDQHTVAKNGAIKRIEKRLHEKSQPYYEGTPIFEGLMDCLQVEYHSFWINYHSRKLMRS